MGEHVHRSGGIDAEAVITRIHLPKASVSPEERDGGDVREPHSKTFHGRLQSKTMKEALEFYVPIAQCSRSISLEALNLELVSEDVNGANESTTDEDRGSSTSSSVTAIRVRVRSGDGVRNSCQELELRTLEALPVRLVSAQDPDAADAASNGVTPRRWTVRLPSASEESSLAGSADMASTNVVAVPLPEPSSAQ